MITDYIKISWKEIRRRKLRSFLTLIGIIIGITAVSSLITLGQGLENAISGQFDSLGDDKLFISAKGSALTAGLSIDAVKLTNDDMEIIEDTLGVQNVAGMIYSTSRIEFNENVRYFLVSGLPTDPEKRRLIGEAQSYTILKGRSLEKSDKYKVVVGNSHLEENNFEKGMELGDKILIQNKEFKIIGFLDKIGSPPDDHSFMIPLETYQEIFDKKDEIGFIIAQIQPGEEPSVVSGRIEKELREHRNLDEGKEDFSVESPEQLLSAFTDILDIIQIVIVGIAAISLLVGGIGIMNTMFTTVLQRTREIGILKAIGAKDKDILLLFLIESGFYGLGGGAIGIFIGISLAKIVEKLFVIFLGPALLSVKIDLTLIIGLLLFSFVIGCISGLVPAWKASKSNPVESLRYE